MMKKILLLLFIFPIYVLASVLVVDNQQTISGFMFFTTTKSCEGTTNPYKKIKDAVDRARSGDTIHVCSGTYDEQIKISKNNLKIVKSSDADGAVVVKNNNDVFTIDGASGVELSFLKIESKKKVAVYIKKYANNLVFSKLEIRAKKDAFYVKDSMGSFKVSDSNITSSNDAGIVFNKEINGNLDLENLHINSKSFGIYTRGNINAFLNFTDVNVKTTDEIGIYITKNINGGLKISGVDVEAKKEGIKFYKQLNKNIEISDTKIVSGDIGLYFRDKVNDNLLIQNVDINSTNSRGIEFYKEIYGRCEILDSNITAYDRAIYVNSKQINPTIKNSNIKSINKSAIYAKNLSWTKLTLKDSCVQTNKSGLFALWMNTTSTNAEVTGNCFYAQNIEDLAKAKRAGNNVSGNYWDKNSGDYVYNNISDTSTLSSCNLPCFDSDAGGGTDTNNTISSNNNFDSWDTFRNINDRNISTKIANEDFYVSVASLNETDDGYEDFNGTVCTCIGSTCFKNLFVDNNLSSQTIQGNPKFNISKATKNTTIKIHWLKDTDANCPLVVEDNSTTSSDNFAIRPKSFSFSLPMDAYAEDNFLVDFNASGVDDYNETKGNSFEIESNITKVGCNVGTLHVDDFSFENGSKKGVILRYSNIGELNITIKEIDGNEFAFVDRDDTNQTQRFIEPFSSQIVVKPYELNVTDVIFETSTGKNWIYMAGVDDLNLGISAKIVANDKLHQKLDDFNSTCYAKDVNVSFKIGMENGDGNLPMQYKDVNGTFTTSGSKLLDRNKTMTISKNDFILGDGYVRFVLNVDRNRSKTENPFELKDVNVSIENNTISKNENNLSKESSVVFYYGRLVVKDVQTNKDNTLHNVELEVYDANGSKYVDGLTQNSLKWYENTRHNLVQEGDISDINATLRYTLENTVFNAINIQAPSNGKIYFTIPKHSGSYIMHIKTKKWLWYVPSDLGNDYNDSVGSNCISHPCFRYTYVQPKEDVKVESGTFNGGDIKVRSRGIHIRNGVKLYR